MRCIRSSDRELLEVHPDKQNSGLTPHTDRCITNKPSDSTDNNNRNIGGTPPGSSREPFLPKRPHWLQAIVVSAFLTTTAIASDTVVTTTTLEWPPYTSAGLPKGGATTEVIRQAFEKSGLGFDFAVLPWKRAISEVRDNAKYIAYFPGYHCSHLGDYYSSDPVGTGPLGFAEHVEAPITWKTVEDISTQNLTIGTVQGYANTEAFDKLVAEGSINAVPARDDLTNLRKLVHKRVDAVVIDKLVLSYLLASEPSLKDLSTKIRFNPVPLEEKNLYLCFNPDGNGEQIRDQFNTGLTKININAVVERYFAEEF